jgi:hypothetical protein
MLRIDFGALIYGEIGKTRESRQVKALLPRHFFYRL